MHTQKDVELPPTAARLMVLGPIATCRVGSPVSRSPPKASQAPLRRLHRPPTRMDGLQPAPERTLARALPPPLGALALVIISLLLVVSTTPVTATPSPQGALSYLPWRRSEKTSWFKGWSGLRMPNGPQGDTTELSIAYVHEQTLAIIELGKGRILRNCELIELFEPNDLKLMQPILKNATKIGKPIEISFDEMMGLMNSCHSLENPTLEHNPKAKEISRSARRVPRNLLSTTYSNSVAIFNGIVPGTKWCGTGDIAATYYDLGLDNQLDRCCRSHDLCPVKIRSYQSRYNLTNNSIYSKSHCECDTAFYRCLKDLKTSTADVMGNVYFNIVQVPCVEHSDDPNKREAKPKELLSLQFSQQQLAYR